MTQSIKLGVNIDHVATVRQARGTVYPDPAQAAKAAISGGADSITIHLREDRRHIQDHDVIALYRVNDLVMNLEMAATTEMLAFVEGVKPKYCCLVPEKREELTTEGGLDIYPYISEYRDLCQRLAASDVKVSLFIDTDEKQVAAAAEIGVPMIEIHTGHYADARRDEDIATELEKVQRAARQGAELGLQVNAGHGLHYGNVTEVAAIAEISELNIGHSIVAHSIIVGMENAVREMKSLMLQARQ